MTMAKRTMPRQNEPDDQLNELRKLLLAEDRRRLDEIGESIRTIEERLGSPEHFEIAIAASLARAFQRADILDHERLAAALSPILAAALRHEAIAETLSTNADRLVSRGLGAAFRRFLERLDARLEAVLSPRSWYRRLKARITGRPHRQSPPHRPQPVRFERILLIDRQTGALVAGFPQPVQAGKEVENDPDHGRNGISTATIQELCDRGLPAEGDGLRIVDIAGARVFLRATPSLTIAAIGHGGPPGEAAKAIGDILGAFLQGPAQALRESRGTARRTAEAAEREADLATILTGLNHVAASLPPPRRTGLAKAFLLIIGLALAVFAGYRIWQALEGERIARQLAALENAPVLGGYPVIARYDDDQKVIRLRGIVPDAATRRSIESQARRIAAPLALDMRLVIDRQRQLRRDIDRQGAKITTLERRLARLRADFPALFEGAIAPLARRIETARESVRALHRDLSARLQGLRSDNGRRIAAIRDDLARIAIRLDELSRRLETVSTAPEETAPPGDTGKTRDRGAMEEMEDPSRAGSPASPDDKQPPPPTGR